MSSRIDLNRQLQPGDTFRSDSNQYRLTFQEDGNFVLYKNDNEAIWNSGTYSDEGAQGRTVIVQGDGNVVMYDGNGTAIWATSSNYDDCQNPYLRVQDDGNLVLYDDAHGDQAFWASNTNQEN